VNDLEAQKKQAALKAVEYIQSGMLVGLGTGSTAKYAIIALGERLRGGQLKDIRAVATSRASEVLAREWQIPLFELDGETLDLAIDGMDELDPELNAIKGLGGALTREKIVESCADTFILIGDETKTVIRLGEKAPIPVEVVPFGWKATQKKLEALGLRPELRLVGTEPFITDNHNFILHCHARVAFMPKQMAADLASIPGVVEHGLFLEMASLAYIATQTGVQALQGKEQA
jgi:ribose 5-phosphate isomerase A